MFPLIVAFAPDTHQALIHLRRHDVVQARNDRVLPPMMKILGPQCTIAGSIEIVSKPIAIDGAPWRRHPADQSA
jgi:hypothetical protein